MFSQEILQKHIYALKDHVGHKCSLYADPTWNETFKPEKDFWYNGFHFVDNRIEVYNIMIYSDKDWDNPKYLDISKSCAELLKYYNHYHVIEIASLILKRFFRDNLIAENYYIHFKYYEPTQKPKRRYSCEKHRSRQSKYIESNGNEVSQLWHRILISGATKEVFINAFSQYRKDGFNSLYFPWQTRAELSGTSYE